MIARYVGIMHSCITRTGFPSPTSRYGGGKLQIFCRLAKNLYFPAKNILVLFAAALINFKISQQQQINGPARLHDAELGT